MTYIYMDESGDLGFNPKKKNSRYFVVTFLFVDNKRPIEKVIKSVHAGLKRKLKRKISVLHATKETVAVRNKLLQQVATKECTIMSIYLDKTNVYSKLQNEKAVLYNYIVNILLDRVFTKKLIKLDRPIEFIASRRETSKFLNANFKSYLESQILNNHGKRLHIKIIPPHIDKLLQAVDFISWAIFRKLEHNDDSYYKHIEDIIIEENKLF